MENVFVSVSAHSYPGSPFNHLYPHNVFQIFSWQFCSFLERASIPLRVFSHWLVIVRGRDTALQLLCDHSAACARSSPREEVNQGACDCQVTPVHPSVSVSCLKVAGQGSHGQTPVFLGQQVQGHCERVKPSPGTAAQHSAAHSTQHTTPAACPALSPQREEADSPSEQTLQTHFRCRLRCDGFRGMKPSTSR